MKPILGKTILVRAPASIANLGPGYDVLAMALEKPEDEVLIRIERGKGNIYVNVTDNNVPGGKENSAYAVARAFIEAYDVREYDIHIIVKKGIPVSAGLGGSGATSAAVAYGLVKLFNIELSKRELLELAGIGEAHVVGSAHYDNVAASLFGGIVLVDPFELEIYNIVPKYKLFVGVIVPYERDKRYKTKKARAILPKNIDLRTHVRQSASIIKLVHALHTGDIRVLGKAISSDYIIEPKRSVLIREYWSMKKIALGNGALGFNIAGAGPSVFFIHESPKQTTSICNIIIDYLRKRGIEAFSIITSISEKGVLLGNTK